MMDIGYFQMLIYNIGNIGLFEIKMIHFELLRVFEIENNYVKNNYVYIYVKQFIIIVFSVNIWKYGVI